MRTDEVEVVSTSRKIIPVLTGICLLIFLLLPQVSADWCLTSQSEVDEFIEADSTASWTMQSSNTRTRRLIEWSSGTVPIHVYVYNSTHSISENLQIAQENQTSGEVEFIIPTNATWSLNWVNPGPDNVTVTGPHTVWVEMDTCIGIPGFPLGAIILGLLVGITIPLYAKKRKSQT